MGNIFVQVWSNRNPDEHAVYTKRFTSVQEAWKYIVAEGVKYYTVWEATCILDNSPLADLNKP